MKLSRINTILVVLIILINGYVVVTPFVPQVVYWWQNRGPHSLRSQLQQRLSAPPTHKTVALPKDNRLIVPVMNLDQPIIEGNNESALMKGPWRQPGTSTPDKGGNTVIAGHRFTYTNPRGTFYFLDKLKIGDEFGIYWHSKAYVYKVTVTENVPPTQVSILDPTSQSQVTLFSCTPLWWPKDRIVVIGTLERTYE